MELPNVKSICNQIKYQACKQYYKYNINTVYLKSGVRVYLARLYDVRVQMIPLSLLMVLFLNLCLVLATTTHGPHLELAFDASYLSFPVSAHEKEQRWCVSRDSM